MGSGAPVSARAVHLGEGGMRIVENHEVTEQQFQAFIAALKLSHTHIRVTRTEQVIEGEIEIKITAKFKRSRGA